MLPQLWVNKDPPESIYLPRIGFPVGITKGDKLLRQEQPYATLVVGTTLYSVSIPRHFVSWVPGQSFTPASSHAVSPERD